MSEHADVLFAAPDGHPLRLNLYLPDGIERPPLVVWVHGGGWWKGSHHDCRLAWLTEHGYAVASVAYRLSDIATFPSQIHDCKSAVRWLRAHEAEYGYDASRIVAAGNSAGGYLALLLGLTAGKPWFEGDVGGNTDLSSHVTAVVDFFGPTDFVQRAQSQPHLTDHPDGTVYRLLGGPVIDHEERARRASPITHVTADAPPLQIIHGDADKTVLPAQSKRLYDTYCAHGANASLHVVPGAGHGGESYDAPECRKVVVEFLGRIGLVAAKP